MAFPWDVAAFMLVFVVIVVALVRMSMKARSLEQQAASADSPLEKMLLRFVEDESGSRLGETVAVEGDKVIVKTPQGFLAIPGASLTESGAGLKLTGALDHDAAKKEGEAWREKSHKVITYDPKELPPEDRPEA